MNNKNRKIKIIIPQRLPTLAGYKVIEEYQKKAQEQQVPQQPQQASAPSMGERPRNQPFQGPSGHWFITTQIADEAGRPTGRWHTHPTDPPNAPAETSNTEQPKAVENPSVGASRSEQQASKRKVVDAKKMEQGLKLLRADTLTDERVNQVASLLGDMKIDELEKLHQSVAQSPVHRKPELVKAISEKLKGDGVKEEPKKQKKIKTLKAEPENVAHRGTGYDTLGRYWEKGKLTDRRQKATSEIGKRLQDAEEIHQTVDSIATLHDDKRAAINSELNEVGATLQELYDLMAVKDDSHPAWAEMEEDFGNTKRRQNELYEQWDNLSAEIKPKVQELLGVPERERLRLGLTIYPQQGYSQSPGHITLRDKMEKQVREAQGWLTSVMELSTPKLGYNVELLDDPKERSGHNLSDKLIKMSTDRGTSVVVHELGHMLEDNLGEVRTAATEFLAHRVGNEKAQSLGKLFPKDGYRDDEMVKKDKFNLVWGNGSSSYYAGKSYEGGATEIIAMGLEELYKDPVHFCRSDPEYATLIIGILNGKLRSEK